MKEMITNIIFLLLFISLALYSLDIIKVGLEAKIILVLFVSFVINLIIPRNKC